MHVRIPQIIIALLLGACALKPITEKSDHYNGETFFNPGVEQNPGGFWNGLRLFYAMMTSPAWVKPQSEKPKYSLPQSPKDKSIAITFVNHATFAIQSSDTVILTDPVWSKRVSPFTWIGPKRFGPPGIGLDELQRVDAVLISHNHYDHMDIETLLKIRDKFNPVFVVALGDKKHLEKAGIHENVRELDWWQSISVGNTHIMFTPCQHFSSRSLWDRNETLWGSYWITMKGKALYFAGDTGYSPWFKEIHKRLGSPDVALLPIGAYEPYWFMKIVHMNPTDAVEAHLDLHSRQSIGMHFGTFKLTTEPIDEPAKHLERALFKKAIDPKNFLVPQEGSTYFLN